MEPRMGGAETDRGSAARLERGAVAVAAWPSARAIGGGRLGQGEQALHQQALGLVTRPAAAEHGSATVPVQGRQAQQTEGADTCGPGAIRTRVRPMVLYVEDDESNRRLMARAFARILPSVELVVASLGAEGVAAAFADPPALVLLDGQLPDMTGQEVLTILRADARTRAIPIVMVSGRPPAGGQTALAGHLLKPIDLAELQAVVHALVDGDG